MSNYNKYDKIRYGTDAERIADTVYVKDTTAKFYVYGDAITPGTLYVSNGTIWTLVE